jgi:hypothetical protein
MGSEIRENWTRGINYLLSEKKTGFWANQYFSCAPKQRFTAPFWHPPVLS